MRSLAEKQIVAVLLILLLEFVSTVYSQGASCLPNDCVVIQQCPGLYRLLTAQPRNPAAFEVLKSRNCGYEQRYPKVCCTDTEKKTLPAQDSGRSTPVHNINSDNDNNNNDNNIIVSSEKEKLLPEDCGRDLSNRIVGGNITEIDEFPWMALLEYRKPNNNKATACGGALINKRYVLTAAHCVASGSLPQNWHLISVRLGEYNTATHPDCVIDGETSMTCTDDPITVGVEQLIVHEGYRSNSADQHNDIALVRLSDDVDFTPYVKPICLPDGPAVNKKLTVAGWGRTESKYESEIKLKVSLPPVDKNYCSQKYQRQLADSQLCAGGDKGRDSCRGDSGGPLMQMSKRSTDGIYRWVNVGVVSFGPTPCGMEGWPGVYTNVYYFRPWILSKITA